MNEARESFAQLDASDIENGESFTINVVPEEDEINEDNVKRLEVTFKDFEGETERVLEARLDQEAIRVLDEAGVEPGENLGYELVREHGETSRRVAFVVTDPHL